MTKARRIIKPSVTLGTGGLLLCLSALWVAKSSLTLAIGAAFLIGANICLAIEELKQ